MKKFGTVVCAGTFDLFHEGHKGFLRFAYKKGDKVMIGITSDEYSRAQKNHKVESFEKRKENLEAFLKEEGIFRHFRIMRINDIFGPTLNKDFKADAIAVSENTVGGARVVNKNRKKKGLPELPILVKKLIKTRAGVISSSSIRKGLMNRRGESFVNNMWLSRISLLPQVLREELKRPMGKIVRKVPRRRFGCELTVTVGDVVTKTFNDKKFGQELSVVDFKVSRIKQFHSLKELGFLGEQSVIKAKNPAGSLSPSLFRAIRSAFRMGGKVVVEVDGEEDLAVLPVLLYAPLGSTVFYGQPSVGMVQLEVNEETKQKAFLLVSRFGR